MLMRSLGAIVAMVAVMGCASDGPPTAVAEPIPEPTPVAVVQKDAAMPLYFESPEQAVTRTTELLKKEDWPTLARYYDLSGTKIDPATLRSGEFFLRKEKPEAHHPGLPWKYRHPFTPGFKYADAEATGVKDVTRVTVAIAIDQGDGQVQRGNSTFDLRKSDKGHQILPEQVNAQQ